MRVIHSREELIATLRLAIDLEVSVMLQYLYAAYTLPNYKSGCEYVRRGLWQPDELAAICGDGNEVRNQGWRGVILDVAHEEMTHFIVANNLLMALGEPFHAGHPRFGDVGDQLNGVELSLEMFNQASLSRFIELERPEPIEPSSPLRNEQPFPASISEVYSAIRDAFIRMPELIVVTKGATGGEHHLFLNQGINQRHPDYQLQVDDLPSALFGIDFVVAQGEGGSHAFASFEVPHFDRFIRIEQDYCRFLERRGDPTWTPAYPALKNPTLRPNAPGRTFVRSAETRELMAIANECYALMVLMMIQHFAQPPSSLRRSKLMNASIDFMTGLLRPMAATLATMPSGVQHFTAGPSFEDISLPTFVSDLNITLTEVASRCLSLATRARRLPQLRRAQTELLEFYARYFEDYAAGCLVAD